MLEEIHTDTKTYKFGTTDLNFTLCLNKEYNTDGKEKSECYIVESLRDEDCFSKCKTAYEVNYIFQSQMMQSNIQKCCLEIEKLIFNNYRMRL